MAKSRKARISIRGKPVIHVSERFLELLDTKKKIVYLFLAKSPVKYSYKRTSRIVYIGQTKRKGERPFESLKKKAPGLLQDESVKPRVRTLDVIYLEAKGRRGANMVDKFERVCLHEFRAHYGKLPHGNIRGKVRLELTNEEKFFRLSTVKKILISVGQ